MRSTREGGWTVRAVRDVDELRALESWRLRWSEELGAWLYFAPAPNRDQA